MARFGLIGASYTSQSRTADAEACINWYVENMESQNAKSSLVLYPTPGESLFVTLPNYPTRGMFTIDGRFFAIGGPNFYEVSSAGIINSYGPIQNDGSFCSMTAGPSQILFATVGQLWVFNLQTNTLTAVNMANLAGNVSQVKFSDGFFIALIANSNTFQVSALEDATSWSLGNLAQVSTYPDNVVGMEFLYRELVLLGNKQSQWYYNSGALFPYSPISSGFMEQGLAATFGMAKADNSLFWIGMDERGQAVAWRANGYTPVRISTYAIEFAWQGYAKVSDAVSYAYQDQGHTFWVIYFPAANKTWCYDAATQLWHERSWFNATLGRDQAHRSWCHAFCFGMHLVGDPLSGAIYQLSVNTLTDFGGTIKRVRRCGHISNEQQWIFHHKIQLDLEVGLGPQPPLLDGFGNPRGPEIRLRWSDDAGKTWSNYQILDCGQAGQFLTRVIARRLGRSRDRIYEISATDAIPWRVIDGYLEAEPGFEVPKERISSQLRKVS